MLRLPAAHLAYGTLAVVVATTLLLVITGAGSLPAVFGLTLIGLAIGAAVAYAAGRGSSEESRSVVVESFVPLRSGTAQREREHSLSR